MSRPARISIGDLERQGAILQIQDGNHGEKHPVSADYVDAGIPFVMAKDVTDGSVDVNTCKFLTEEQADSLRIGVARPGDVLLTHKGTVGSVAVVPPVGDYVMLTPQVTYYRVAPDRLGFALRAAQGSPRKANPVEPVALACKVCVTRRPVQRGDRTSRDSRCASTSALVSHASRSSLRA